MLAGDGHCDSPGECAKYCTYSLTEQDDNVIVHMEIVNKREVQSHAVSQHGERGIASVIVIFV